jgi:hypothetical protein
VNIAFNCSFALEGGDWEAWLSRFPRIFKFNPKLKRVVIASASQSGCGGYDDLIYAILENCPEVEYLDVSENYEDQGQGPALAAIIKKHPSIKHIEMGGNDLEEENESIIVKAIRQAAEDHTLVLEELGGLDLKEAKWRKILGLSADFKDASNKDILAHLRIAHSYQLK